MMRLIIIFLFVMILSGCNNDSDNPVNSNLPPKPKMMFINAAPFGNSGFVKFIFNGDTANTKQVNYGNYLGYTEFNSGFKNIGVEFNYGSETVHANLGKNLENKNFYSCVAYDLGSPSSASVIILNELPVLPNFNIIKVRVVNFFATEQPIDFFLYPTLNLFRNVDFMVASNFVQLEPGTFDFSVKSSEDTTHTILQIFGQNLSLPRAYSYFIAGYSTSPIYIKTIY